MIDGRQVVAGEVQFYSEFGQVLLKNHLNNEQPSHCQIFKHTVPFPTHALRKIILRIRYVFKFQRVFEPHQVLVPVVIDPRFSSLACCLLLQDFVGQDLGGAQRLDGVLVLKDVALRCVQHVQDLVLDVLQVLLVLVDLENLVNKID